MRISTKGRYALRLMLDLAMNHGGGFIPLKAVAQRQEISDKYLEQIIHRLNREGLVESARGAQEDGEAAGPAAQGQGGHPHQLRHHPPATVWLAGRRTTVWAKFCVQWKAA